MVRIAGVDLGACRDHMAVAMARLERKVFKVDAVADLIADGEIAAIDSTGTGRMA